MQYRPTCPASGEESGVGACVLSARVSEASEARREEQEPGAPCAVTGSLAFSVDRGPGVFRLFFSEPWKSLGGVREAAFACARVPELCASPCVRVPVCAHPRVRASPCVPTSQGCWRKAWDGLSAPLLCSTIRFLYWAPKGFIGEKAGSLQIQLENGC